MRPNFHLPIINYRIPADIGSQLFSELESKTATQAKANKSSHTHICKMT